MLVVVVLLLLETVEPAVAIVVSAAAALLREYRTPTTVLISHMPLGSALVLKTMKLTHASHEANTMVLDIREKDAFPSGSCHMDKKLLHLSRQRFFMYPSHVRFAVNNVSRAQRAVTFALIV